MKTINKTTYYLEKANSILLVLMVFTLPLNMFLNNLFLSIFLGLFAIYTILTFKKKPPIKRLKNYRLFIILNIPVLLLLIGMTYSPEIKQGLKEFGRLIPITVMLLYLFLNPSFFNKQIKYLLYALLIGTLISALISWGGAIFEIYQNNDTLMALFTREYANHHLSEKIGIHTPYLALFVNTSIGICVYSLYDKNSLFSKMFLKISLLILIVFLFNLMARNAIFCFILFGFVLLVKTRKYILLASFVGVLIALSVYIFTTEKNFLRDRFFKSINIFETETIFSKKDSRFDRIKASYEVFKQFPLLGTGTANSDMYRLEQYYINRDSEAYNENYNSHNQFMEYLSTYGLLGGISFILLISTLFKITFSKKSFFLFFMTSSFFIATFTESLLERSWGIVYYIVLILFILSWNPKEALYEKV